MVQWLSEIRLRFGGLPRYRIERIIHWKSFEKNKTKNSE